VNGGEGDDAPPQLPADPWAAPPAPPYGWVRVPAGPPPYSRAPHTEPEPYHRLLRTVRHRWWQPLVGLVVAVLLFLIVGIVVYGLAAIGGVLFGATEAKVLDQITDLGSPVGFLLANLALAAGIPAAWAAVAIVHRERIGWLASVACRLRWRLLLVNAGLALGIVLATYLVYLVLPSGGTDAPGGSDAAWPGTSTFLAFAAVIVLTTPLQAAGEEYAFRGYLTQALGAWIRWPVVPALVSATLFAVAHGTQGPWLFADRFAFGLVASWLTLRTGGLESAIALHTVNNAGALLVAAAVGEFGQALTQTDIAWQFAVLDIVALALFGVLSLRLARRRQVATRSRALANPEPGGSESGGATLPR
jgi:membrane protease YdiL (CAAX protease family)